MLTDYTEDKTQKTHINYLHDSCHINHARYEAMNFWGKIQIRELDNSARFQHQRIQYRDGNPYSAFQHLYLSESGRKEAQSIIEQFSKYKVIGGHDTDYNGSIPQIEGQAIFNIRNHLVPSYLASLGYQLRTLPAHDNIHEFYPEYPIGACKPGTLTVMIVGFDKNDGYFDHLASLI